MFVAQVNVLYNFLIDPIQGIETTPKLLQFISISVAPASILAAVSYIMSRRYGSRSIGAMIIASGVIIILGMTHAYMLIEDIDPKLHNPVIEALPIVFAVIGIPIILVGASLLRKKNPKRRSSLGLASDPQNDA